jgi:ornithine cyclodeaminase/alanine dehydrogenase-like protein (mu-crystallin family)
MCNELSADLQRALPSLCVEQLAKQDRSEDDYHTRLRAILSGAGLIFCCTPSTEPLFCHSDLGVAPKFLSMIGSYKPQMREVVSETLLSGGSKVFVDSTSACLEEALEIVKAKLKADQLIELGSYFAGEEDQSQGVASATRNIIFKSVGMGIMDLAIAQAQLEIATTEGIGQDVDGF